MSTADSQHTSDTDHGPGQTNPNAPDIVHEARRIGLQPTIAYVPRIQPESADERKKRLKRERAREKRIDAQARGFHQINIPEVPTELVDSVKCAVAAVLAGHASSTPAPIARQPAQLRLQSRWQIALMITAVAVFAFCAGTVIRLL